MHDRRGVETPFDGRSSWPCPSPLGWNVILQLKVPPRRGSRSTDPVPVLGHPLLDIPRQSLAAIVKSDWVRDNTPIGTISPLPGMASRAWRSDPQCVLFRWKAEKGRLAQEVSGSLSDQDGRRAAKAVVPRNVSAGTGDSPAGASPAGGCRRSSRSIKAMDGKAASMHRA